MTIVGYWHYWGVLQFKINGDRPSRQLSDLACAFAFEKQLPTREALQQLPDIVENCAIYNAYGLRILYHDHVQFRIPAQCPSCKYFHGEPPIVCAVHPTDAQDDCKDFES